MVGLVFLLNESRPSDNVMLELSLAGSSGKCQRGEAPHGTVHGKKISVNKL